MLVGVDVREFFVWPCAWASGYIIGFHKQTEVAVILKELEARRVGQNLGDVGRAAVMSSKLRHTD